MRTMQWKLIQTSSLPTRVHSHSAGHTENGCMYIYGGSTITDEMRVQVNTNVHKMWLTIPKLKDMCWDAVTYYNDNLDGADYKALHSVGIPPNCIDSLPKKSSSGN